MNEQEIILGIILLVCLAWVARRTFLCFKRIRKENDPCAGCPCGCKGGSATCTEVKK